MYLTILSTKIGNFTEEQSKLYDYLVLNKENPKIIKTITGEFFYKRIKSLKNECNRAISSHNEYFKTKYEGRMIYIRFFTKDPIFNEGFIVVQNNRPKILEKLI